MAIKGKSRKRSKARGPALPPKPAVGARKQPLPARKDVKRAVVILLTLLAFLGGLRVWQNDSRHDAAKAYTSKLLRAQQPLFTHLGQDSPTNLATKVQAFTSNQLPAAEFLTLAALWEKDFTSSAEQIKKLKAPNEVTAEAQNLIALAVDEYAGVARLYNLAGQIKQLADAEKDAKKKAALDAKVQVALQHAEEWRQRADEVSKVGNEKLRSLLLRYHVIEPQPTQTPAQQ